MVYTILVDTTTACTFIHTMYNVPYTGAQCCEKIRVNISLGGERGVKNKIRGFYSVKYSAITFKKQEIAEINTIVLGLLFPPSPIAIQTRA